MNGLALPVLHIFKCLLYASQLAVGFLRAHAGNIFQIFDGLKALIQVNFAGQGNFLKSVNIYSKLLKFVNIRLKPLKICCLYYLVIVGRKE